MARKRQENQPPPRIERDSISNTRTEIIRVRDTVLVSVPDSLYYSAYIECVNNKPVLKDSDTRQTPGVRSEVGLKDGKLTILVNTEAQRLFMKWKERFIQEQRTQTTTISVPYPVEVPVEVPAPLTVFQTIYLWLGRIAFFGLIGFIIYKLPWRSFLRL